MSLKVLTHFFLANRCELEVVKRFVVGGFFFFFFIHSLKVTGWPYLFLIFLIFVLGSFIKVLFIFNFIIQY